MNVSFRVVISEEDLTKAMVVRGIVFCGEQGIPYKIERDQLESSAIHVIGEIGSEPVAAGRVRFLDSHARLERIAVRAPYRSQGIGHKLTEFLVFVARERGYTTCLMNAQAHLESLYVELGFKATGKKFLEADIEHVLMTRED